MAWNQPTQITSWSFSRLATYEQCPLRAKLLYLDKIKEPQNKAMARGSAIHEKAEKYLKGEIRTLPKEIASFGDHFKKVKKIRKANPDLVEVESMWGFTKDWQETPWNNWGGCSLRVKLDQAIMDPKTLTLSVEDVKTGKFREYNSADYLDQLELYRLTGFLKYHPIYGDGLVVRSSLLYVDEGKEYAGPNPSNPPITTLKDIPALKKSWERRVKPMLTDKKFRAKPNDRCKWCIFSKNARDEFEDGTKNIHKGTCKF